MIESSAQKPRLIRPGLVSVTFRAVSVPEVVRLASGCGLEGIEWGGDVHVPVGDLDSARRARDLSREAGLEIVSYGSYWRADGAFGPVLETAQTLGAPNIRVWAGSKGSQEEPNRSAIVERLREACQLAAEAKQTISLEYHAGTLTDTFDSTIRLVAEIDHPALRLYWQPVPERSPAERIEEVRALLPFLSHLHVFQWRRTDGVTRRLPLSDGEAQWPDVFAATPGDRFALLEFVPNDDPSILSQESATLRRWLSETP